MDIHPPSRRSGATALKKARSRGKDELRKSYKRSDFPAGFVRGNYATRLAAGSNVVVLSPENAAAFPTSDAVNEALNGLVRVSEVGASNKTFERQAFPVGCRNQAAAAPPLNAGVPRSGPT